ncbi:MULTISPECIES: hypothetical protein [unclassified Acidovorax]|uniref:hypothetical protein n=1 Tax=unclassified Acidovorax TaxID=2684926 RepID=UPI00138F3AB1|nr:MULTISPECIES: hypothetical protein [unclassified Acidovorax]
MSKIAIQKDGATDSHPKITWYGISVKRGLQNFWIGGTCRPSIDKHGPAASTGRVARECGLPDERTAHPAGTGHARQRAARLNGRIAAKQHIGYGRAAYPAAANSTAKKTATFGLGILAD